MRMGKNCLKLNPIKIGRMQGSKRAEIVGDRQVRVVEVHPLLELGNVKI